MELEALITRARRGDLTAYARVVDATQHMVHAACFRVLRRQSDALDASQETYLRAFKRLGEVRDPAAFPGWLRRIAVTTSLNLKRVRRRSFLSLDDVSEPPVLDELESTWSQAQRMALAAALVGLAAEDRRLCDRFYHGRWTIRRLADEAGVNETAMRKRLQRIRDKLRKDIEMSELADSPETPAGIPAKILELLARPKLVDLPENPVGVVMDMLRQQWREYAWQDVPEIVNLQEARQELGHDPVYVTQASLHCIDEQRILRFDLTVPLLMWARRRGAPLRVITAGKVYRNDDPSSTRLQVFHQLELLVLAEKSQLDAWSFAGSALKAVDALLPNAAQRIGPADYPICSRAWELGVEKDGAFVEIAGGGVYGPDIVRFLGGDPDRQTACGLAFGLERVAALKFGYDDLRKLEEARVEVPSA
jgi:RNA polymerase sigma-70 factor, ECF subfamily